MSNATDGPETGAENAPTLDDGAARNESAPLFGCSLYDCIDRDDPAGRTYRQVNAAKTHAIPLGSLVELCSAPEFPDPRDGARLFVVSQNRDCDMTPLYYLSLDPCDTEELRPGFRNPGWSGGYQEHALTVIRGPKS